MKNILLFVLMLLASVSYSQVVKITVDGKSEGLNVAEVRTIRYAPDGSSIIFYGDPPGRQIFCTETPNAILSGSCGVLFAITAKETVAGNANQNVPLVLNRLLVGRVSKYENNYTAIDYWKPPSIRVVTAATIGSMIALMDNCAESAVGDDWGAQAVILTGTTLSGNGTVTTPLKVATNGITSNEIAAGTILMSDIGQNGASSGQVIKWNGSAWAPAADGGGGGADNWGAQVVVTSGGTLNGNGTLAAPLFIPTGGVTTIQIGDGTVYAADWNQMGASTGQVMKWAGSSWAPANIISAGAISVASGLIGDGTVGNPLDWTGAFVSPPITGSGTSLSPLTIASNSITTSHIATGGVGSAEIIDGDVALSDMANMPTSNLIYRRTVGTGPPEYNSLATLKTDLGLAGTNSGDQTITLTTDVTGSGTGTIVTTIANNAITNVKMADNSVGMAEIINGSVDSIEIAQNGVSLRDVAQEGAAPGQVLKWNGNMWLPSTDNTGSTPALVNTHIFVGNASNLATDVALSGDASITNTGNMTVLSAGGVFAFKGKIAASTAVDVNNLSTTLASVYLLTTTAGNINVGGFAGGADGRTLYVLNDGTNAFNLLDEAAGSTAANRFDLPGNATYILRPGEGAMLWYNFSESRWNLIDANTATNLGTSNNTATTIDITSSTGTTATIPAATSSLAGLMTAADKTKTGFISITQPVDLDVIEAASHAAVTVTDNARIDFVLTGQNITADLLQNGATTGQALVWNGSVWAPATVSGGGSTNLAVTGTSSPLTLTSDTGTDVTFTAGSGITLAGSSSNITINNTKIDSTLANNGVSLSSKTVQLGNVVGSTTAQLSNDREIPMAGNRVIFTGNTKAIQFKSAANDYLQVSDSSQIGTLAFKMASTSSSFTKYILSVDPPTKNSQQSPFYMGIANNPQTGQSGNNVMMMGWNLSPGGGKVESGKPYIGESWEQNYRPGAPTAYPRYIEKHDIYMPSYNNTQRRISSFTIVESATGANYIDLYHTVDAFRLRDTSAYDYFVFSGNPASSTARNAKIQFNAGSNSTTGRFAAITVDSSNNNLTITNTSVVGVKAGSVFQVGGYFQNIIMDNLNHNVLTGTGGASGQTIDIGSNGYAYTTDFNYYTSNIAGGKRFALNTDVNTQTSLSSRGQFSIVGGSNSIFAGVRSDMNMGYIANNNGSFALRSGVTQIGPLAGAALPTGTTLQVLSNAANTQSILKLQSSSDSIRVFVHGANPESAITGRVGDLSVGKVAGSGTLYVKVSGENTNTGWVSLLTSEVDGSISNEGSLTVAAGTGTTSIINSNTSGSTGVTLTAAGALSISEVGNTITLTATEVDGSTSNELQTFANTSDATSHTLTLSNAGGTIQFIEGTNVTFVTGGTSGAGTVTISASGGGSTNLAVTGTSSPLTLTSDTGTDVTITAGSGIALAGTSGNITISATGGGASNYQLLRDDGTDKTARPNANFVSSSTIGMVLTDDAGNTETEIMANILTDGVTSNEIAANAVGNSEMADNAIGNAEMADNAVNTAEIVDGGVALADMANVASGTVFYRTTAGAGVPQVTALSTLKTDLGLTGTNSGDQTITLTGEATGSGAGSFAVTLTNASVIGKVLTGYTSGAGTVSATDNILQAIQKLNGNDATNANLTGMVTSVGNATTVVTNANLTGDVTSSGNATTISDNSVDGTDIAFGSDALGDTYHYNGTDAVRLAGNITTTKQFFTQTGNGSVSAAPAWGAIAQADVPAASGGDVTGLLSNLQIASGVVGSAEVTDNSLAAGDLAVNVVSSVEGVDNDGGNIDLIGAGILAVTSDNTANTITFTATEVDGSVTNEAQAWTNSGTTTWTGTLASAGGSGGGSTTIQGLGIVGISHSGGTISITGTEVDGNTGNEGSLTVAAGGSNDALISSNTAGSTAVKINGGTNITITENTGTGEITIAAAGGGAPSGSNTHTVYYNGTTLTETAAITTNNTVSAVGGIPATGFELSVLDSLAGDLKMQVKNKRASNASARSSVIVDVNGDGAGDADYSVTNGSTEYRMGLDNDQTNNPFVMTVGASLGANNFLEADATTATVRFPFAPYSTAAATITGATTLTNANYVVICNSASNFTVTLPATITVGKEFKIYNINTGIVTISAGSNNINGSASNSIILDPSSATIFSSLTITGLTSVYWSTDGRSIFPAEVNLDEFAPGTVIGHEASWDGSAWGLQNGYRYARTAGLVTNSTTTLADITGLSFAVLNGNSYSFRAIIRYSTNATTTGTAWAINGPAGSVSLKTAAPVTSNTEDIRYQTGLDSNTPSTASPATTNNTCVIEGIVKPTANGTYILRFASEVAATNAVIVQTDSQIEFRRIN